MNELNLYQLFRDIITNSKKMNRFVVAPQYGIELNKNNVGEILKDIVGGISDGVKYPICLMFPPVEIIDSILGENEWSRYSCKLFFLTTPYSDEGGIQLQNLDNNLSEHTIPMTWKDMHQCAIDFRKVFEMVTERNFNKGIRSTEETTVIERFSDIGNDRLAGVGISFIIDLFLNCEILDYEIKDIDNIKLNIEDLHNH
ncbi:hypothetical protein ETU08_00095 [Apibacter muscae]|uniref:hypothetical protein n=1 Tax=Apibacter muscae TaxID=2509004 RepID=UPI0011ADB65A|nr:hypothetical protein [Apibacter muscae]TWP31894.1 hypothetical protein ETU08_00095 [Apibacter muscae]